MVNSLGANLGARQDARLLLLLQAGPNWTRPVLPKDPKDDQLQGQGHKRVGGKVTPGRAVSGAMEDELAGKMCTYVEVNTLSHQQRRRGCLGGGGGGHIFFKTKNTNVDNNF